MKFPLLEENRHQEDVITGLKNLGVLDVGGVDVEENLVVKEAGLVDMVLEKDPVLVNQDLGQDVSQDVSQDVNQDLGQDVSQDVSQDVNQDVDPDPKEDVHANVHAVVMVERNRGERDVRKSLVPKEEVVAEEVKKMNNLYF